MNKKSIQNTEPPLLVIVGPTASGKSSLAMKIAREYGGEIICADSRTVYKGMDIGTAKPSAADQASVPHWGLDLVQPNELFTAADFQKYAREKIADIRKRGKIPLLVGGTGLYVDGVIFDYQFGKPNGKLRQRLETLALADLLEYCANNNIEVPENAQNKRYVIRAIEQKSINTKRLRAPAANTLVVGIATNSDVLRARIAARAEQLFDDGMVEEAILLGKKYSWNSEAMTGNIYKLARQFSAGELTREELLEKSITADWRLAKRQRTWLKRNPYIHWFSLTEAYNFIKSELSN